MSNNKKKINFMSCSVETFLQYFNTDSKTKYREPKREICPCCGKSRYSYEDAMHVMKSIKTGKENRSHDRIFLRAYRCSGWWHLTSSKTEKGQRKLHYAA